MPTSPTTLDAVHDRLAEVIATPHQRSTEEQQALIADLLALAFEARLQTA
jgi:hypothetical protein